MNINCRLLASPHSMWYIRAVIIICISNCENTTRSSHARNVHDHLLVRNLHAERKPKIRMLHCREICDECPAFKGRPIVKIDLKNVIFSVGSVIVYYSSILLPYDTVNGTVFDANTIFSNWVFQPGRF